MCQGGERFATKTYIIFEKVGKARIPDAHDKLEVWWLEVRMSVPKQFIQGFFYNFFSIIGGSKAPAG
jgi:hypothetical protein